MAYNASLLTKARPDLITNWNNANNMFWVAENPQAKGMVDEIKSAGSLDAYLQRVYATDPSGFDAQMAALPTNSSGGVTIGPNGMPVSAGSTTDGNWFANNTATATPKGKFDIGGGIYIDSPFGNPYGPNGAPKPSPPDPKLTAQSPTTPTAGFSSLTAAPVTNTAIQPPQLTASVQTNQQPAPSPATAPIPTIPNASTPTPLPVPVGSNTGSFSTIASPAPQLTTAQTPIATSTAPTTLTTPGGAGQTLSPTQYATLSNAQAYLNANPQVAAEIQGVAGLNGRDPAQWLVDHVNQTEGGMGRFSDGLKGFVQQNNLPLGSAVAQAATPPGGGNYSQNQNSAQTGQFNTVGQTNIAQQQTTGQQQQQQQVGQTSTAQTGVQQSTGTQAQTGGQTQATSQTGTTSGTSTVAPVDTLGFGSLLRGAADGAQANDATRTAFLTDLVQTGGQGLQGQFDEAIRNSLTGPQVTGAGDSARARIGSYAAERVARNNTDQRLAASGQLAGPTALSSLSTAANPFVGQTATNTGTTTNTGTSTGTNFSNLVNNSTVQSAMNQLQNTANSSSGSQAGFTNLVGTTGESSSGTASGTGSQSAAGQIPSAQSVNTGGGGGCVLCTAATELGLFNNLRVLRRVIEYKLRNRRFSSAARGYFFLFTPLARWLLGRPRLARRLYPLARAVVYEELRVSGRRLPLRKWASFVHWTGHALCHIVGKFPVPGRVTDPVIEKIARKNNIWFSLQ